jgi:hypothetical protein
VSPIASGAKEMDWKMAVMRTSSSLMLKIQNITHPLHIYAQNISDKVQHGLNRDHLPHFFFAGNTSGRRSESLSLNID